jgi:hypothetical protein
MSHPMDSTKTTRTTADTTVTRIESRDDERAGALVAGGEASGSDGETVSTLRASASL